MAEIIKDLEKKIGNMIIESTQPKENRIYLRISPDDLFKVINFLFFDYKCKLCTASGMDMRDGIEIVYHMAREDMKTLINVKTLVPYPNPTLQSVGKKIPAFLWIEREIHEMLGVEFKGHPNMKRLLLADSFPKGKYPLRKDFKHEDISNEDYEYERSGI